MWNIIYYYIKLYYYGSDTDNCTECTLTSYANYYSDKNECKNYFEKKYCKKHEFLGL